MGLTEKQRDQFERDGVLVIEGFADTTACKELIERSREMLEEFEPESISVFTTHEQTRTSDDYFLESGDKVRFFFEEDAFLPDGSLKQAKELSINKIGHAMHDLDPVFSSFSRTADLAAVAADVGFEDPKLLQSMYIFKQPSIGGEVTCHQDSTFLYTDPMSLRRLLVRARGRHARERVPVGRAWRAPRAAAQAVQTGARRRHRVRDAERCAVARAR